MQTDIYNTAGKKKGTITLPESVFGVAWNDALMHQVVTSMQDNARVAIAHTKGRGEVRGGGRKPWRQKGTGRARAGSSRSPIWVGGGVSHGPRKEKNFSRAIPAKMRAKALFMALSKKLEDGKLIFVDSFGCDTPKTAVAKKALVSLQQAGFEKLNAKKNAALVAFANPNENTKKSFRNLEHIDIMDVRNLNPVAVLGAKYLIIEEPEAAVAIIATRVTAKKAAPKKND